MSGDQMLSLPGRKRRQMPGVCPGEGCLSFNLTGTQLQFVCYFLFSSASHKIIMVVKRFSYTSKQLFILLVVDVTFSVIQTSRDHRQFSLQNTSFAYFYFQFQSICNFRSEHWLALPNETSEPKDPSLLRLTQTDCKYVQIITTFTPSGNFNQLSTRI